MSLIDNITGEEVYNPHIRIYNPSNSKKYLTINSTTYGEEIQEDLIFPEEVDGRQKAKESGLYAVTAVVVSQSRLGHKRPQNSGHVLSETLIGYLTKERMDNIYFNPRPDKYL